MNRFSSHGPDSGVHGVPPARSPPTVPATPRSSGAALGAPGQATAQGPSGERDRPWLSVVIPSRNTPDLTLGCLASLQEAGSGVEVIVVDDASSDGAPEAVEQSFSMYCQDLDFCLRASELGWTTELVEELGVVHHHGATIGRSNGIAAHQDLVLLWADLVRWAGKHRGERWRRRVQRTLCWGGRMRLGCRYLVRGLLRRGARVDWNRDTQILRRAIRRAQNGSPPVTNGAATR